METCGVDIAAGIVLRQTREQSVISSQRDGFAKAVEILDDQFCKCRH